MDIATIEDVLKLCDKFRFPREYVKIDEKHGMFAIEVHCRKGQKWKKRKYNKFHRVLRRRTSAAVRVIVNNMEYC